MKLSKKIENAVSALRAGKLVAIPTETVYGLGADALNVAAVKRIFTVKQRPTNHPLIVHIPNITHLEHWASELNAAATALATHFWPGPLTLILKRATHIPALVTGGHDTIALRIPQHPMALAILQAFDSGVAAPSANRFGYISPTCASHVQKELGDKVDLILDGGYCTLGIESTIVDVTGEEPKIMRLGAITPNELNAIVPLRVVKNAKKVPGAMPNHYAPHTPLYVESYYNILTLLATLPHEPIAVLSFVLKPTNIKSNLEWIVMPNNPKDYARLLYARLREVDNQNPKIILVEKPPRDWLAIHDRLNRARFKKSIHANKEFILE